MTEKLVVVIVLYYPDEAAVERVMRLSGQVKVVAVDNTPAATVGLEGPHINYVTMGVNSGIAAAQNSALDRILKTDAEYVLFLDQDSSMSVQQMEDMIDVYRRISQEDQKTGAVGALPRERDSGKAYKSSLTGKGVRTCRVGTLISSGMLTTTAVIREVGCMDASLFIDYVDFEWCWRASGKGWHLYLTDKVTTAHKVGERTLSAGPISFVVSAPVRYYYKTRNLLLLCRRDYVPRRWIIRTLVKTIIEPLFILTGAAYRHRRGMILKNFLKGIYDGFKGQEGLGLS